MADIVCKLHLGAAAAAQMGFDIVDLTNRSVLTYCICTTAAAGVCSGKNDFPFLPTGLKFWLWFM